MSASTTFGACVVAPLTATFLNEHPQVRVELELSNRRGDLVDEGGALAIRIGGLHNDDVVAKPLRLYRMTICASPDYLVRYGEPRTPDALQHHRCLSHMVWNANNEWKLPGAGGEMTWRRDLVFRCNDGQALRMAAVAGAGVLLQPETLLSDELANGKLVRVLTDFAPQSRQVWLRYRQQRRPLPQLTRYIAHLLEHINAWVSPS